MAHKKRSSNDDFVCPHCGADVAVGASFCRACGASDEDGWGDESSGDNSIEDDFDYDEFIAEEFPAYATAPAKRSGKKALIAIVAVILCISILLLTIGGW